MVDEALLNAAVGEAKAAYDEASRPAITLTSRVLYPPGRLIGSEVYATATVLTDPWPVVRERIIRAGKLHGVRKSSLARKTAASPEAGKSLVCIESRPLTFVLAPPSSHKPPRVKTSECVGFVWLAKRQEAALMSWYEASHRDGRFVAVPFPPELAGVLENPSIPRVDDLTVR